VLIDVFYCNCIITSIWVKHIVRLIGLSVLHQLVSYIFSLSFQTLILDIREMRTLKANIKQNVVEDDCTMVQDDG